MRWRDYNLPLIFWIFALSVCVCVIVSLSGCVNWVDLGGGGHGSNNSVSPGPPTIPINPPVLACVKDKAGVVHVGHFVKKMGDGSGYQLFVYSDVNDGVPSRWLLPDDPAIVGCER